MGDSSKFQTIIQYYMFNIAFVTLLISEAVIFIKTYQKNANCKRSDKGTKWLLIGCYGVCIYLSAFMVSQFVPSLVRNVVLPKWCAWIGIGMIFIGVMIRLIAVFTLKKAFTVTVQTTDSQKLITTGIYRLVRNPAYTGSILSLLGVAVAYRSIPGIVLILLIAMACYSVRIRIEEVALENQFGTEFTEYKANSWRLVPYVW